MYNVLIDFAQHHLFMHALLIFLSTLALLIAKSRFIFWHESPPYFSGIGPNLSIGMRIWPHIT